MFTAWARKQWSMNSLAANMRPIAFFTTDSSSGCRKPALMSGLHSTAIHTIDSADIPVAPSRPRHRFNIGVGMALGFVIGV